MNKLLLFLSVFSATVFSSCSSDLDVLDDYKETMVIYGLLNQNDTAQYLKINKAFSGAGNAYEMAQVYDSINYANTLTVKLDRVKSNAVVSTISLTRDSLIAKDPGDFSSPNQILYKTKSPLFSDSEYKLTVLNTATGNIATSITKLIQTFTISRPTPTQTIGLTSPTSLFRMQWTSAINGKSNHVTVRFHYVEVNKLNLTDTTKKYIDWEFNSPNSTNTLGGQQMEVSFIQSEFYKFLKSSIPVSATHKRHGGKLDFIFIVGGEQLTTYIEVNQPSIGLVQEKPQYTNIKNGYGIFSSRLTQMVADRPLNLQSLDSLYGGQYTKLIFCDPNPGPFHCN